MITWTPDGSLPLVEAQEDEINLSASITAVSDDPAAPVVGLSWNAEPAFPSQFSVTVSAGSLTLAIPDFVGFFQIQEIRYLLAGEEAVCTAWGDLPPAAEDVIAFRPDPVNVREHVLSVTAEPDGSVQDYVIRVWANYTVGRDALEEAINARRN